MRKAAWSFGTLLVLVVSLAGQSGNWKTYKNDQGNFSVLFPGDPTDTINKKAEDIESHTLLVQQGSSMYMVVYSTMSSPQKVDEATFQEFKNAMFKELPKCEVESEQAPAPALDGFIGRYYKLGCALQKKVGMEGNVYWGKKHAYAVFEMSAAGPLDASELKQFLGSFSTLQKD